MPTPHNPHARRDRRTSWSHRAGHWGRHRGSALLRGVERAIIGSAAHRIPTRPLALRPPSGGGIPSIVAEPRLPGTLVAHGTGAPPAPWLPITTAIDPSWTYWIHNAEVAPSTGAVWLPDGTPAIELIGGLDRYTGSQDVRGLTRLRPRETLAGTWCVMPQHTYYHFLLEDLPALLDSIAAAGTRGETPAGVLTAAEPPSYVAEFLASTGVPVVETRARKVRIACLVGSGFASGGRVHPASIARIREHFLPDVPKADAALGTRSLYVSRVGFRRSPPWEHDLIGKLRTALPQLEVLESHDLSLSEQVAAFAGAGLVIGVHGAGLSSIVFAPASCRVVEIATTGSAGDHFWRLATERRQDYRLAWVAPGAGAAEAADAVLAAVFAGSAGLPELGKPAYEDRHAG